MTVRDSRTEEERGNAADLLKLVMVRQKVSHSTHCPCYCSPARCSKTKYYKKELVSTVKHFLLPYNFLFLWKSDFLYIELFKFFKLFLKSQITLKALKRKVFIILREIYILWNIEWVSEGNRKEEEKEFCTT